MVTFKLKKKKAQLLTNFTSPMDVITRFKAAGFYPFLYSGEHGCLVPVSGNGFTPLYSNHEKVLDLKLDDVDIDVHEEFTTPGFVGIQICDAMPSELARILLPATACMYGPNDTADRIRIYKAGPWAGNDRHFGMSEGSEQDPAASVLLDKGNGHIWVPPGRNEEGEKLRFADGWLTSRAARFLAGLRIRPPVRRMPSIA
jgi:hypothetical protein